MSPRSISFYLCLGATACTGSNAPGAAKTSAKDSAVATTVISAPGSPDCPQTGKWARCSVLYRLERSGIAPRLDSADKPAEQSLHGDALVVKFGVSSVLELHIYPDSAARMADEAKLDKTQFVAPTAPQSIKRERTLIENNNVIGLLSSINDRLRERVSDAITAGAPQPTGK